MFDAMFAEGFVQSPTPERLALGTLFLRLCDGNLGELESLGATRGSVCGRIFKRGELVYRCKCAAFLSFSFFLFLLLY